MKNLYLIKSLILDYYDYISLINLIIISSIYLIQFNYKIFTNILYLKIILKDIRILFNLFKLFF